jgi:subtilisin family serine protease
VDSGVFDSHPHVGGVAGGVALEQDGREHDDYIDRLGHGTAVAAAIKETAPGVDLFAIRIFSRRLATDVGTLIRAIDWAARANLRLLNLSLGVPHASHEDPLGLVVDRAAASGLIVVAAAADGEAQWWPGSLPTVIRVRLDWGCPSARYRVQTADDGAPVFSASGYARTIPGVHPERNLKGISFAVARMTGFAARVLERQPDASLSDVLQQLQGTPDDIAIDDR